MIRVNGKIEEATREEMLEMYLMSNWHKTCSFESFLKIFEDEGCIIKEGNKCDYQTEHSAQTVQSMTLEQKTIATVTPTEKEKIVSEDTMNQQMKNSAISVNTKENVSTNVTKTVPGTPVKKKVNVKVSTQSKVIGKSMEHHSKEV